MENSGLTAFGFAIFCCLSLCFLVVINDLPSLSKYFLTTGISVATNAVYLFIYFSPSPETPFICRGRKSQFFHSFAANRHNTVIYHTTKVFRFFPSHHPLFHLFTQILFIHSEN